MVSCCGEPDGDPLSARPRPPSRPQRRVPAPTAGRAAALACLHCAALPFPEAIALFSTSPRFPSSPTRSMLVAGRRTSAQCVQERQISHPRHLPEGTTAESLRPASLAPCRPGSPFAVLPGAPPPVCCFPGRPWPCRPCRAHALLLVKSALPQAPRRGAEAALRLDRASLPTTLNASLGQGRILGRTQAVRVSVPKVASVP